MNRIFQFHRESVIPAGNWIWVFGSTAGGAHRKGSFKIARVNFRAEYGCDSGPTGHAYAIPTQGKQGKPRTLLEIFNPSKNLWFMPIRRRSRISLSLALAMPKATRMSRSGLSSHGRQVTALYRMFGSCSYLTNKSLRPSATTS